MWFSGRVFTAKGEVLDPNYNGEFHRPSDMKAITRRFYDNKRTRDPGESPIPLLSEHDTTTQFGTVQHMYIDADNTHRCIVRLNMATPLGKEWATRIKNGERPGLSWGTRYEVMPDPKDPSNRIYGKKYVTELSLVKTPAHHADSTFVTEWGNSLESLVEKEFGDLYAKVPVDDAEADALALPSFLPSALKAEIKKVFQQSPPPATAATTEENTAPSKEAADTGAPLPPPQEAAPDAPSPLPPQGDQSVPPGEGITESLFNPTAGTKNSDVMDLEPPSPFPTDMSAPIKEDPKKPNNPANQQQQQPDAMDQGDSQDSGKGQKRPGSPIGADGEDPAGAPPPAKKPRIEGQEGGAAPTSYPITGEDVAMQTEALADVTRELIQTAGLLNASREKQTEFITELFNKQKAKYQKHKEAQNESLAMALRDSGIPEEDISRFVDEASKQPADSTAGQLIRTLTSVAAAGHGGSQMLSEARRRESIGASKSYSQRGLDDITTKSIHNTSSYQQSRHAPPQPPASAPPPPQKSLDFSAAIFSRMNARNTQQQQSGGGAPPQRPTTGRVGDQGREQHQEETEEERGVRTFFENLSIGGLKINRRIAPNPKLAITNLRSKDDGRNELDTIGIPDHIADRIQPNGFTHHMLEKLMYPDLEHAKGKHEAEQYGDEKSMMAFSERYYDTGYPGWRSRIITGGTLATGDEL